MLTYDEAINHLFLFRVYLNVPSLVSKCASRHVITHPQSVLIPLMLDGLRLPYQRICKAIVFKISVAMKDAGS